MYLLFLTVKKDVLGAKRCCLGTDTLRTALSPNSVTHEMRSLCTIFLCELKKRCTIVLHSSWFLWKNFILKSLGIAPSLRYRSQSSVYWLHGRLFSTTWSLCPHHCAVLGSWTAAPYLQFIMTVQRLKVSEIPLHALQALTLSINTTQRALFPFLLFRVFFFLLVA